MKKMYLVLALVTVVGFAGFSIASAHSGYYGSDDGYGYCDQNFNGDNAKGAEAFDKFRSDTTGIRKDLVVKRNELTALMRQDNPDEKRVATLSGEVFDLETDLDKKAAGIGFNGRGNYGHGPGMMRDNGYRGGRHMMDW